MDIRKYMKVSFFADDVNVHVSKPKRIERKKTIRIIAYLVK